MHRCFLFLVLLTCVFSVHAQNPNKKTLTHDDLLSWQRVTEDQLSPDGKYVTYTVQPEQGNSTVQLYDVGSRRRLTFERSDDARIDRSSQFLACMTHHDFDSLRSLRREKVDDDDLPSDTLNIYSLSKKTIDQVAGVSSYKFPKKWGGWIAFIQEVPEVVTTEVDTMTGDTTEHTIDAFDELVIRNMATDWEINVPYVDQYIWAEEGKRLALVSTSEDSTFDAGVYIFDVGDKKLKPVFRAEGEYSKLSFDRRGEQLSFISDLDTTDQRVRPYNLHYLKQGQDSALVVADEGASFLPANWLINDHKRPSFSEDGKSLYFGINPPPILQDTTFLDDEIVQVEVWSYTDGRLHTQQNNLLESERNRAYTVIYSPNSGGFVQLGDDVTPEVRHGNEGNARYSIGTDNRAYLQRLSWVGFPAFQDVYLIDNTTGNKKLIAKEVMGSARFSPSAKYVFWYETADTAFYSYEIASGKTRQITNNNTVAFYQELHDTPNLPSAYGVMGWDKSDEYVYIYDRYDIWKIDPRGERRATRLTNGREQKMQYRYISLDPEKRFFEKNDLLLLYCYDEKSKSSGYANLKISDGKVDMLFFEEGYTCQRYPEKALDTDKIVFSKENFNVFPDLYLSDRSFKNISKISDVNPQQDEYNWGSMELYEWTSLDGQALQGMLVKPEDFDPNKKYPMIVNFYERSSERLNRYRRPYPGRSTINYPFYASKGYVIFNPDVPYRTGYPGESAYNAVMSGVTALMDEGYIDPDRIGAQGHSWGGYQVAYLATKTDLFACIESGAPVVNMTSAYGGIRWGSGLSRMFQYERTQSRIGATLWEKPIRYIENSPLFFIDKINTPILILHNDEDGAVPWYQGIEFFVAMRRLGKPAWMLNYNGEPHWPVKLQNRVDFNIRMQQFFDHYLLGAKMPKWMHDGVPAIEKGINQGLELIEE